MVQTRPSFGSRLAIAAIVGLALIPTGRIAAAAASDLDLLTSWMTGDFSSAVQAAEDPDFFDVSLHIATIWPDLEGGHWLYVEQAMRDYPDQPYRQRVYRLRELVPGLFEIQVYTLPAATVVVGAWQDEHPLAELGPDDLIVREGCSILMRRRDDTFVGSTLASLCDSSLRGASYATSEVVVTPDGIVSWDRGFAADGTQVWGATKGGYVFDRIVDDPDPESASESESVAEPELEPEPGAASDPLPGPDSEAVGRTGGMPDTGSNPS